MTGLHVWLHRAAPPPRPEEYPTVYQWLIQEQSTLGWWQLFNGCLTFEWARLHKWYSVKYFDPLPDNHKGIIWTLTFIDTLWRSFRQVWDSCNGTIHCTNLSKRTLARQEQCHQRAPCSVLPTRHNAPSRLWHIPWQCCCPYCRPTCVVIRNWLLIHTPMVKHSIKEAARLVVRNVCTLVSYFGTLARPT
jgi:hypothetical protein